MAPVPRYAPSRPGVPGRKPGAYVRFLASLAGAAVFLSLLFAAASAPAAQVKHFKRDNSETVAVELTAKAAKPIVARTGERELTITFGPPGKGKSQITPGNIDLSDPALVRDVSVAPDKIVITLSTSSIGFIGSSRGNLFTVQIYEDPLGAKYVPANQGKPDKRAESAAPPDKASGDAAEAELTRRMGQLETPKKAEAKPKEQPGPPPVEVTLPPPPALEKAKPEPTGAPAATVEPFYAVPHSLRARVEKVGPKQATVLRSDKERLFPEAGGEAAQPSPPAPPPEAGPAAAAPPDKPIPQPAASVAQAQKDIAPQPAAPVQVQPPPAAVVPAPEGQPGQIRAKIAKTADGLGLVEPSRPGAPAGASPPETAPGQVKMSIKPAAPRETPPAEATAPPQAVTAPPAQALAPEIPPAPEKALDKAPAETQKAEAPKSKEDAHGGKKKEKEPEQSPEEKIQELIVAAQNMEMAGELVAAAQLYDALSRTPGVSPEEQCEALYKVAGLLFRQYRDDLSSHYMLINGAFQKALAANPKSMWIPHIMAALGNLNLRVGNMGEAAGYFNLLKQRYPTSEQIPLINYYWGEYYYAKGEYRRASEEYQSMINQFPESEFVKEAATGLIKSFVKMNYYREAAKIVDYAEKRWPRHYLDEPLFLLLSAEIAYRLEDYPRAKKLYLQFYNIDPTAEGMDLVLSRLGDVYLRQGQKVLAKQFYDRVITGFPESDGAQIAKMRLAEEGVFDDPSVIGMNAIFGRPQAASAGDVYREVVEKFPNSSMAPLALLKLALWRLYQGDYPRGLRDAKYFLEKYPGNDLTGRAEDIAAEAVNLITAENMKTKDYKAVVDVWKANQPLFAPGGKAADKTRLAVAYALLKQDDPTQSLAIAKPFVTEKQSDTGEIAFGLVLRIYTESQAWPQILELAQSVTTYRLAPAQRRELDYSLAMAYENMGDFGRSRPLWAKLASDMALPPSKRALAMFYNALTAKERQDWEKTLIYAREALTLFESSGSDPQRVKDSLNILIDVSAAIGRLRDAVRYAEQFARLTREGDLDWAANQFKLASFFRNIGDMATWRATLENIRKKAPGSTYARMADTALEAARLEQAVDNLRTR